MKVTGPMMSIDASGTFAKTLVASKWKGRNYMRAHAIPSNPKSAGQTAFRAMFKFLGGQWQYIAAGDRATWDTMAANKAISPFNAYMGTQQKRWRNYMGPSQRSPADATLTPANITAFTATAGVRQITVDVTLAAVAENWGLILWRTVGAAPTNIQTEVIAVIQATTTPVQYVDLGLTPGVNYFYEAQGFTLRGEKGVIGAPANATPTA